MHSNTSVQRTLPELEMLTPQNLGAQTACHRTSFSGDRVVTQTFQSGGASVAKHQRTMCHPTTCKEQAKFAEPGVAYGSERRGLDQVTDLLGGPCVDQGPGVKLSSQ